MNSEETWVLGRFPDSRTREPNSPIARAKASAAPARIAGVRFGKDDPAEDGQRPGAQRRGGLLHLAVELQQHRLDGADDERQGDEQERQDDAGAGERDIDPHRAVAPVEGEQGDPGDDRRQGERKVDHRVHDPLAGEACP